MSLYAELAEYVGREETLVRERCEYAAWELAWLWPQYAGDPTSFYTGTDLYIYDLTEYQQRLREAGLWPWVRRIFEARGWRTLLDYGGGIGQWSILAAEAGLEVTYYDLDGPTRDYALWRFARRGLHIQAPTCEEEALGCEYDAVVVMDVLEHLPDPAPLLDWLSRHTRYIFANPEQIRYNGLYPQHISRYELAPRWRNVERYLWERSE